MLHVEHTILRYIVAVAYFALVLSFTLHRPHPSEAAATATAITTEHI